MTQKLTILFDLDGTLVDTAPDLLTAHNHVMEKFGYDTKSLDQIKDLVGKGAAVMITRSIWGNVKKEFSRITDEKTRNEVMQQITEDIDNAVEFGRKSLLPGPEELLKGVFA